MILTLAGPLAMSFEKKINFVSKWKNFLIADAVMMLLFIPWDIWFTLQGVWSFNSRYYLGIEIFHLPLEEWLFFIFVPFACYFIYENVKYFVKIDLAKFGKFISIALIILQLSLIISAIGGIYTLITFSLNTTLLIYTLRRKWLGKFHLSYLISGIPFAIVNGILTYKPVVIYNDAENLGFRLGTIPFEDFFYGMLFMLIVVEICEKRS